VNRYQYAPPVPPRGRTWVWVVLGISVALFVGVVVLFVVANKGYLGYGPGPLFGIWGGFFLVFLLLWIAFFAVRVVVWTRRGYAGYGGYGGPSAVSGPRGDGRAATVRPGRDLPRTVRTDCVGPRPKRSGAGWAVFGLVIS
jgi:hypothetical protein